jgi:abortive infection bacteriophage resistance protein
MAEEKGFKTLDEQIGVLRQHNIIVSNETSARSILEFDNYYCIVNGYKDPFLDKVAGASKDFYKNGTTLEQIWALFLFDRDLRRVLLQPLLLIEHHVATTIAYEFSRQYGHHDDSYLRPENFDPDPRKGRGVTATIEKLKEDINIHRNDQHISHYLNDHQYIPLWVLVNVVSFGQLSKFYANMRQADRNSVARHFLVREEILESFLSVLSQFRNQCAHNSRTYSYKARPYAIRATPLHSSLSLPRNKDGKCIVGLNDILAVLICTRILCGRSTAEKTVQDLDSLLSTLKSELATVSIGDVTARMGLPDNWQEVCSS